MLQQLRIDSEFESKIPPLREEEFKQLEENILADRKSTRLNSSHDESSRMPSSA